MVLHASIHPDHRSGRNGNDGFANHDEHDTGNVWLLLILHRTYKYCNDHQPTDVFQWEKHSPAVQKLIAMIIARGQTLLQIKASGFIPINLELFAKVSSSGSSSIADHIMYRNIYK